MHSISILHMPAHNFIVEIDDTQVSLSYKSFGGYRAVKALGESALAQLLYDTERAIVALDYSKGCKDLFKAVGVSNAMALLELCCRDEFLVYWKNLLCQRKQLGLGCSFRCMLAEISGTKATLGQNSTPLVGSLRQLCREVWQNPSNMQNCMAVTDEVCDGDLRACFIHQSNNSLVFGLNDQKVSFCANRVNTVRTSGDLLRVAQILRHAVLNGDDVRQYVDRWGGSFVFRVLQAVNPAETVDYFHGFAQECIRKRLLVRPRKVLKDFGFPFNDRRLRPFGQEILSALEQFETTEDIALIKENQQVIRNFTDKWKLFYKSGLSTLYRTISFEGIICPTLRSEAVLFMRAYACANGEMPVTQIARCFYLIRSGLNALGEIGIFSITGALVAHVRHIKTDLQCTKRCSANHISEVLQALGCMYSWAMPQCDIVDNPFWCVDIPNKRAFLQTTTPARKDDLRLIADHLTELPDYVQLGHRLLTLTLARAHDVFHIRLSNLEFCDDGTGYLRFFSSKNGVQMLFYLPADFVRCLRAYIDKTAPLRKQTENDFLFLYMREGLRSGSTRRPSLLTYSTYNYHVDKLMTRYSPRHHMTTRQIRAEGGRRYHSMGMTSSQVSIALGNTAAVAKKHYRTLTPRDEAELYHRTYATYFAPLCNETALSDIKPLWGRCVSAACRHKASCQTCPYRYTTEVTLDATGTKSS